MNHINAWPKMMLRKTAAAYCDLSEVEFEREVLGGTLPGPVMLGKKPHWSRKDLDAYLDRLASGEDGDWRTTSNLYAA